MLPCFMLAITEAIALDGPAIHTVTGETHLMPNVTTDLSLYVL